MIRNGKYSQELCGDVGRRVGGGGGGVFVRRFPLVSSRGLLYPKLWMMTVVYDLSHFLAIFHYFHLHTCLCYQYFLYLEAMYNDIIYQQTWWFLRVSSYMLSVYQTMDVDGSVRFIPLHDHISLLPFAYLSLLSILFVSRSYVRSIRYYLPTNMIFTCIFVHAICISNYGCWRCFI